MWYMNTTLSTKYQIQSGDKLYESDHTVWTFVAETDEGLTFRADDGLLHTFAERDLSVLARYKGSERAIT